MNKTMRSSFLTKHIVEVKNEDLTPMVCFATQGRVKGVYDDRL